METTVNMTELSLFASGVIEKAAEMGLSDEDACVLAEVLCKEAASKGSRYGYGDDDEEEESWWSRHKHVVLPLAIGAGAFLLGADAGKHGRKGHNSISNAAWLFGQRLKALLGMPSDPEYLKMVTPTDQVSSETANTDVK